MTDFAAARANMVESQVRPNDVTDPRILQAMLDIPRENFIRASLRPVAYMDEDVRLDTGGREAAPRYLMAPMVLAKLIQLAEIEPADLVLDIGCGTGYSCAVAARMAEAVVGLESDQGLAEDATRTLLELEVDNAVIVTGPLADGYAAEGPYDVILMQGSVPAVPETLLAQLKDEGRLVTVIGDRNFGRAMLYRSVNGDIAAVAAFDAGVPPVPGFEQEAEFVF